MIETERLILRPFKTEDAADLYAYLAQPTVNCFMDMKLADMDAAVAAARERSEDPEFYFAIQLKDSGKVIGEIVAHPEGPWTKDTFSPCWMLAPGCKGMGYGYEAARAYFDYLFNEKGARRIYAYTEDYNIACQHLCEKLGMRREGLFKEFISFVNDADGQPVYENTYQYAILKKEWQAGVGR